MFSSSLAAWQADGGLPLRRSHVCSAAVHKVIDFERARSPRLSTTDVQSHCGRHVPPAAEGHHGSVGSSSPAPGQLDAAAGDCVEVAAGCETPNGDLRPAAVRVERCRCRAWWVGCCGFFGRRDRCDERVRVQNAATGDFDGHAGRQDQVLELCAPARRGRPGRRLVLVPDDDGRVTARGCQKRKVPKLKGVQCGCKGNRVQGGRGRTHRSAARALKQCVFVLTAWGILRCAAAECS